MVDNGDSSSLGYSSYGEISGNSSLWFGVEVEVYSGAVSMS